MISHLWTLDKNNIQEEVNLHTNILMEWLIIMGMIIPMRIIIII